MGRELAATALALAAAVAAPACKKDREPASTGPSPATARGPGMPEPLATGASYRVDLGPRTPCAAGATCEARLVLAALGGFKVNREYPFKFVADPAPGVTVDGTGTFAFDDAKTGTLTLAYRAERGGPARFAGTFKLSVCTDESCIIESPKLAFELPVE